jgi:hypothetical protein
MLILIVFRQGVKSALAKTGGSNLYWRQWVGHIQVGEVGHLAGSCDFLVKPW